MEKTKDDAATRGVKRQKITVVVGTLKHYDLGYDSSLEEFLATIERMVAAIPVEDRKNVTVDWTDGDECDSGYIEFTLHRDATPEEARQLWLRSGPGRYAR